MQASLKAYVAIFSLAFVLLVAVGFHYGRHGFHRSDLEVEWTLPAANAGRGKIVLRQYGCGGCHQIPGVAGAHGDVGPRLDRLYEKIYIAGVLPQSPQNLITWIRDPRDVDPHTAMPDLGVSDVDARDMAAYLYSLR